MVVIVIFVWCYHCWLYQIPLVCIVCSTLRSPSKAWKKNRMWIGLDESPRKGDGHEVSQHVVDCPIKCFKSHLTFTKCNESKWMESRYIFIIKQFRVDVPCSMSKAKWSAEGRCELQFLRKNASTVTGTRVQVQLNLQFFRSHLSEQCHFGLGGVAARIAFE